MHRVMARGLAGTWRKLGNKEIWRRGMCIGHSEGAEIIKIFVTHVKAQEELTIYKLNHPVTDSRFLQPIQNGHHSNDGCYTRTKQTDLSPRSTQL